MGRRAHNPEPGQRRGMQLPDLGFSHPRGRLAALVTAHRFGPGEPFALALQHHLALEVPAKIISIKRPVADFVSTYRLPSERPPLQIPLPVGNLGPKAGHGWITVEMAKVLYDANPSLLRTYPFATIVLLVVLLAGIVLAIAPGVVSAPVGLPARIVGLVGIVIAAAAFVWLLIWYISTKMDHLAIREDEIVWSHGLIRKQYTEISLSSVRTTRVKQTLMQRIMDAGDVMIFTSGDQPELHIRGLPEPYRIRELLQDKTGKA